MMTCGIIGCGRISPRHIWAVAECYPALRLDYFCDLDITKAIAARERYYGLLKEKDIPLHEAQVTDQYRELLDKGLDFISLASDSGSHFTLGMAVLNAGISLLVEKPMAMTTVQCDLMIRLARQNELTLGVCHQNRFNKWVMRLKEAIDAGKFGELYHGAATLRWNRDEAYYAQAAWRGKKESDGGALMNQGIHNLDLLRWLLGGKVEEVFGYTANLAHPYIEAEDLAVGVLKFVGNTYATIEATTSVYPKNYEETLSIFGKTGSVSLGGVALEEVRHWALAGDKDPPPLGQPCHSIGIYGEGHLPLYLDYIEAVRSKSQPLCDGVEGRDSVELVGALYTSAEQHRRVRLSTSKGNKA